MAALRKVPRPTAAVAEVPTPTPTVAEAPTPEGEPTAAVAEPPMLLIWEFVLIRDDGSLITIIPHWSDTKIDAQHQRSTPDLEVPKSGMGGTSGPGTHKYFKNKRAVVTLRFDPNKVSPRAKATPKKAPPPLPPKASPPKASPGTPAQVSGEWFAGADVQIQTPGAVMQSGRFRAGQ
jgi:hypothetical protein